MSPKIITFAGQNFIIMRKTLLIISFVAIIVMGGNAQTGDGRFGIKIGPSLAWASSGSTAVENNGVGLGYNVGLVYEHYLSDHIAVSSGVTFNALRMKYTFTDRRFVDDFLEKTNVPVMRRVKSMNFEIPIKVKLKFDVVDSFQAYVEAGGGLGFNSKDLCRDDYTFYWVTSSGESYIDCTNQYRLLQLSMIFGLGTEFELNRNLSAFAQLTFDHSFSNAFVSSLEKQTGSVLRNNFVGLEFGILF